MTMEVAARGTWSKQSKRFEEKCASSCSAIELRGQSGTGDRRYP